MRSKAGIYLLLDILLVILAFLLSLHLKPIPAAKYIVDYSVSLILFLFVWGTVSYFFNKYSFYNQSSYNKIILAIITSNLFAFALVTSFMYILRIWFYSRFILLSTVGFATLGELMFCFLYFWMEHTKVRTETLGTNLFKAKNSETLIKDLGKSVHSPNKKSVKLDVRSRQEALLEEINKEAYDFIFHYAAIDSPNTLIVNTGTGMNINLLPNPFFETIINLKRVNDIRRINKFFELVNTKLNIGGLYINLVETKNLRKRRILNKYPPVLNYIYYTFDFIVKRIFPKFLLTKKIYFFLTRGQNRVLTKAETFGRLYSCGFEILEEKYIGNQLFFIAVKTKTPLFPEHPSYGPFVSLNRIGKNGKIIKVYKMRTMHPYSEYLQDYMYRIRGLQNGGKFKGDFRVTTMGKIMRKLWLDELPMMLNLFKGEIKLVGVRPLSIQYFNLYSKELREKRVKFKPGLIPPFYKDNPGTLEEIMASELKYLNAYEKHPFFTDFKYFFVAIYNIIFRHYRSN
ncbi:MAG: sugar transferase [Bacteroidales bacterium]|nr:sugar transferase [Bacteroidales bacterium]